MRPGGHVTPRGHLGRVAVWQNGPARTRGPPWCNGSTTAFGAVRSRFESWRRSTAQSFEGFRILARRRANAGCPQSPLELVDQSVLSGCVSPAVGLRDALCQHNQLCMVICGDTSEELPELPSVGGSHGDEEALAPDAGNPARQPAKKWSVCIVTEREMRPGSIRDATYVNHRPQSRRSTRTSSHHRGRTSSTAHAAPARCAASR